MCVFWPFNNFSLPATGLSSCSGSVARREPARTPHASLGPGRGPWLVLWEFRVTRSVREAFPARTAIQVHANPRT